MIFYSNWQIAWGVNVEKYLDPREKNQKSRKSHEKSLFLLEASVSKIEKRTEFVRHCDMNNTRFFFSKGSTLLRGEVKIAFIITRTEIM